MPAQDIQERIDLLGLNRKRKNPLYIYSDALANEYGIPRAHLANENWRTTMKRILMTRGIKLWVIDNLASLASGLDENSKKDWDPINSWLLDLRFAGIATVMLHHENKEGGQRGTSAREDNIDISISLKRPHDYTPDDGARFIVHFTKARVSTKDLSLVGDIEFKLIEDKSGIYKWTWTNVKGERKREILKMIDEGLDTKTICEALGVTRQYVSKVKVQTTEEGYLKNGKLTQSGFWFISEGEFG
jgi:putative DNA primase/helicase